MIRISTPKTSMYTIFALIMTTLSACSTITPVSPELQAKRVDIHYQLGIDALDKENMPKAFAELMHAMNIDPDRSDVLAALGYAWQLRGDLDKANTYYLRAIKNDPSSATYNNFGGLLLQMNKPKLAEGYFRKALDNPRYPHPDIAYINLGDALLQQNRFNAAISAYHQARILNHFQETSRIREAAAYVRYDRITYAKALYGTILRDKPNNRQALEGLVGMLRKEGKITEIKKQLKQFHGQASNPLDQAWAEEEIKRLSNQ